MNEIADQLANVTSVIVMTLKEFDGVSFAQHVYELVADGEEVVLRVDMDPSGLFRDFKVRIAVAPPERADEAFGDAWAELLYDLSAYTEPLLHMGRELAYQRITREGRLVTVAITDGSNTKAYTVNLSALEVGYPDDFATDFLTTFPE
ncbi:hypothetical protein [Streptomyces sp. L7]|uniref:hypothetical protein n=1 Tax=Streptomyces sp. L7 TaxID=3423954 RepID=UPI003D992A76